MYAKLIDGNLKIAPKKLTIGEIIVWNASSSLYLAQGWKPVTFTICPVAPEGYYYESGWEEQDEAIVQTWTLTELPDEIDETEAFNIIIGGEA